VISRPPRLVGAISLWSAIASPVQLMPPTERAGSRRTAHRYVDAWRRRLLTGSITAFSSCSIYGPYTCRVPPCPIT
jgi:hypothetical protein